VAIDFDRARSRAPIAQLRNRDHDLVAARRAARRTAEDRSAESSKNSSIVRTPSNG
jgi:hypothetical protein